LRAFADTPTPLIVAEGGSADRPQDSRSAFDLAMNEGCDFIQASLVVTKDGALAVRRDNELSSTTDVASRPAFAARKTTKAIDRGSVTGWFAEDFTLAELKTLGCRELWPILRPASAKFDGKEKVLSLQDVLAVARAGCVRTARTIGVFPRILHGHYYRSLDMPVEERLASELTTAGYSSPASAAWVQAFEPESLKAFGRASQLRRMQMIDASGSSADDPPTPFAAMTTHEGLAAVRAYAEAIGADQDLVIDPRGAIFPTATTLALDARAASLQVYAGTARDENQFLPEALRIGERKSASFPGRRGDVNLLMVALFAGGVDGLATDDVPAAAKARTAAVAIIERAAARRR
jgi:glycerophosphoryl diester phosphodiesterase